MTIDPDHEHEAEAPDADPHHVTRCVVSACAASIAELDQGGTVGDSIRVHRRTLVETLSATVALPMLGMLLAMERRGRFEESVEGRAEMRSFWRDNLIAKSRECDE